MTLFEYLTIAFALVLSASAMRLIAGLPAAVDPERRYWVHLSFVVWELFKLAGFFWAFWGYRTADWIFPTFLLLLASAGIGYFNACTLAPEASASVRSWTDYYYSIRRRYFAGVACWTLAVAALSRLVTGLSLLHPLRAIQLLMIALALVGYVSSDRRVHAALAALAFALTAVSSVTVAVEPGALISR